MRLLVFLVSYLSSTLCLSVELNMLPNNNQSIERRLLQFENNNLKQSALLVIGSPNELKSDTIIVMAHGFHPNPSQYGRIESGGSLSPGNYYRAWVNAYAKAGFNVLVPDYRGHNDSEGSNYTHPAEKVEFPAIFYASDLIAASEEAISQKAISQIKNKIKLVSLWSTAKYRLPKINISAKYVIRHGKYDAVTPISNIEFYLQNHKKKLLAKFLYETKQHLLSADDFVHAVSTDIQLIREIENGNH